MVWRTAQELVLARGSGFKSPLPHHLSNQHLPANRSLERDRSKLVRRDRFVLLGVAIVTLCSASLRAAPTPAETRPAPPHRRIGPLPYVVLIGGNVADLVTTRQAFTRGAVEGNGLVHGQPFGTITASKASFVVGVALAMRLLDTHGHPRAARILGYVDGGITFGVAAQNARVAR